jgi:hypothetical protein
MKSLEIDSPKKRLDLPKRLQMVPLSLHRHDRHDTVYFVLCPFLYRHDTVYFVLCPFLYHGTVYFVLCTSRYRYN